VPKDPARLACSLEYVCAVGAGGTINCFGDYTDPGEDLEPPSGSYDSIISGDRWACGRDASNQTLTCWGNSEPRGGPTPNNTPSGAVSVLAGGAKHACAVFDGQILCWGKTTLGRTAAPSAGEAARRLSQ
jgi:hypothetical protein